MYEKFANVKLKTGQSMEVGVVLAPDAEYADEVKKFLGHKPETYRRHIDLCVYEVLVYWKLDSMLAGLTVILSQIS